MSFINRIKNAASEVASSAQAGINQGQAKLQGAQNRSNANDLWRILGQAYYVHLEGRASAEQVHEVVAAVTPLLRQHEQSLGPAPFPPPVASSAPPAPGVPANPAAPVAPAAPPTGPATPADTGPASTGGWSAPPAPGSGGGGGWTPPPAPSSGGWAPPAPPG